MAVQGAVHARRRTTDYLEAMRAGVRLANARGVTAVHDKDGWLGALRLWQQLEERGPLTLRVWQSIPHDALDARSDASALRSGLRQPACCGSAT